MTAYNFQPRFATAVEAGTKTQTIRRARKTRHARKGEPVQLYTGMRTKACRKLIDPDPICTLSTWCEIHDTHIRFGAHPSPSVTKDAFARADGFLDFQDMKDWFIQTHGLPFRGQLIMWSRDSA